MPAVVKLITGIAAGLWLCAPGYGQALPAAQAPAATTEGHAEHGATPDTLKGLRRLLNGGKFEVHSRIFGFATWNAGQLRDHAALGVGMGLGYHSLEFARLAPWFGLHFGMAGYFIFNVASTDLSFQDSITAPVPNRYELGLFDIRDPHNRHDLDRLEELYLAVRLGPANVVYGRMILETPFLNKQDGRMRPTLAEGAWATAKLSPRMRAEGGIITRISPRSTVEWFSIGESIGQYSVGVGPDGRPSGYAGHVESDYLAVAALHWQPQASLGIQAWYYHLHNVFGLWFFQAEHTQALGARSSLSLGAQGTWQHTLGDGGNALPDLAYRPTNAETWVASARLRYAAAGRSITLNATRIGPKGQFQFPREWGREPFYTFLPRERNEGAADVWAANVVLASEIVENRLTGSVAYGRYWMPDVRRFDSNKYGFPAYDQLNLQADWALGGWAQHLSIRLLYVYKGLQGNAYGDKRYIYQKTNMHLVNLILDYRM